MPSFILVFRLYSLYLSSLLLSKAFYSLILQKFTARHYSRHLTSELNQKQNPTFLEFTILWAEERENKQNKYANRIAF